MRTFKKKIEVIVGAVAHEIGHRPKRWKKYKTRINLTPKELDRLCRAEETFADFFAGRALAEVNLSPQPLIDFLLKNDTVPRLEYFPVKMRADVIMRGFNEQNFRIKARKRLFPQQNRMTSIKGHIGNY